MSFQPVDIVHVVTWASIECEKQRSGERSVGRMVEAWRHALTFIEGGYRVNTRNLQFLGLLIEPKKNNATHWRKVHVSIGTKMLLPWHQVEDQMEKLIGAWDDLSADEWYKEFEEIHPLVDGNGRAGNILWNLHRGTLEPAKLDFPPDFWGGQNMEMPDVGLDSS